MLFDRVISFFTSLRLTVLCLCLGMVLVFFGTLAQVDLGLYQAQSEFFRSFLIYWGPKGEGWKIPVFPGGYLVGSALLLNLIAAHIKRFTLAKNKIGIFMVHAGLILLLLGQLLTDMLSRESVLHLRVGEAKNYSEETRRFELAVVDTSNPEMDNVVAIPEEELASHKLIRNAKLPFDIEVKEYYANSEISTNLQPLFHPSPATQGSGAGLAVRARPKVTSADLRDVPTVAVELKTAEGSMGEWLVSGHLGAQGFNLGNRTFQIMLRPMRHYEPFSLQLLKFNHTVYQGTDIPKDFSSRVRLIRPATGEDRETLIYMNNPLRYGGETFYQASFDQDDAGTVLQVVHNPSWLTPYLSCGLMGLGMTIQFLSHLVHFLKRRIIT